MEGNATAQALVWWQAPLYREEGWRPAGVPYFQACLVFVTLVYVFETYLDLRCVFHALSLDNRLAFIACCRTCIPICRGKAWILVN